MNPEAQARQEIDRQLTAAGWLVQDKRHLVAEEIGANAALAEPDLDHGALKSRGGLPRALALFGRDRLPGLLEELNTALAA